MGDTFFDGKKDERPVHTVCVDHFLIGKYLVTQSQWAEVMGNNPSYFSECGEDCPVEQVSWEEVQEFIRLLNGRTGNTYRLPSEAEWEYAARSGGKNEKWAGTSNETELSEYAWYRDNGGEKTHVVGLKRANGLGLYDMSGNVFEWCQDGYDWEYYKRSPEKNPSGASSEPYRRVLRGGSCDSPAYYLRAASRQNDDLSARQCYVGFRLVLSAAQ
jgi:sulfatase modifying factor 1